MKYRAPVCMADMVLDKIDQIKDNKKMMEAMEAEADCRSYGRMSGCI